MGYRSDLGIVLKKEVVPLFREACKYVAENGGHFKEPLDADAQEADEDDEQVLLTWKSIKAYDLVQIQEKFMDLYEAQQFSDDCFKLIRIGENSDDTDEAGSLDDNFSLGITRHLSWG